MELKRYILDAKELVYYKGRYMHYCYTFFHSYLSYSVIKKSSLTNLIITPSFEQTLNEPVGCLPIKCRLPFSLSKAMTKA